MRTTILACVLALAGCSDDSGLPDTGPDTYPVYDCCAGDRPYPDLQNDAAVVDTTSPDAVPAPDGPGPDVAPSPDLPAAGDLGAAKLIEYAQCGTDKTCEPYCGAIGSKSEGWFDGCANQLLKHPTSGVPYWDQCAACTVGCEAVGSYSEGWYARCP